MVMFNFYPELSDFKCANVLCIIQNIPLLYNKFQVTYGLRILLFELDVNCINCLIWQCSHLKGAVVVSIFGFG